jgi:hypothetical protein
MALLSIPLPTAEEPHLVQTTQLEGQSYVFEFNWNSRNDRWTLHLSNSDGSAILDGAILCIGVELLRTVPATLAHVPPGLLYLVGDDDPTLETIGNVSLLYSESTV